MSDNNSHPYEKIIAEIDYQMTLLLVRGLAKELSTELDLHYDRQNLQSIRDEDTIQILVEAIKFLRQHEVELPSALVHVLQCAGEDFDPSE